MSKLQDAIDKVTYEMATTIKQGEEITLNEDYVLYSYLEDDALVVVERENWEEVYWILYNPENKSIEYGKV